MIQGPFPGEPESRILEAQAGPTVEAGRSRRLSILRRAVLDPVRGSVALVHHRRGAARRARAGANRRSVRHARRREGGGRCAARRGAGRVAAGGPAREGPRAVATSKRDKEKPTANEPKPPPPPPRTWIDKLEDDDREAARHARRLIAALEDEGIEDANELVRRESRAISRSSRPGCWRANPGRGRNVPRSRIGGRSGRRGTGLVEGAPRPARLGTRRARWADGRGTRHPARSARPPRCQKRAVTPAG